MRRRKHKRPTFRCSTCGKDRVADSFSRDRTRKSGFSPTCRFCMRARAKLRRINNPEMCRAEDRVRSKKCWDANPAGRAYHYIQARAKKNGLRFTLTVAFIRELFAIGKCAYCDRKISPRAKLRKNRASIDKLIPSHGYTPKNTVLACCDCNRRKDNSSVAQLRMLADGIERLLLKKKWGGKA